MGVDDVQALVAQAPGGDGGAFGELYERLAPEIRRYLLRQVRGHRETAEDLTEEVFLKAFQCLGGFETRALPFTAWLYRIARNHLIDHIRTTRHRATAPPDADPALPSAEAERALANALDRHELAEALARLNEDQRRVVSLRFLAGLTAAETARVVGRSEVAIKKLQARGLAQMRKSIERDRRAVGAPFSARATPTTVNGRLATLGAA